MGLSAMLLLLLAQDPVWIGLLVLAGLMALLLVLGILQLIFAPPASIRREHNELAKAFRAVMAFVQTQAGKLTSVQQMVVGAVLLLIAFYWVLTATIGLIQGLRQGFFSPFVVAHLVIGAGLAGGVVYMLLALRQLSALEIKLSSSPARLGEEIEVGLRLVPRKDSQLDRLVVRLVSQERALQDSRDSRGKTTPTTVRHDDVRAEAVVAESQPLAAGMAAEYRCRLLVPEGAMHSYSHWLVGFSWRLEVEGSIRAAPDVLRQTPLTVLPELAIEPRTRPSPQHPEAVDEKSTDEVEELQALERQEYEEAARRSNLGPPETIATGGSEGVSIKLARAGPFRLGEEVSGRVRVQSPEQLTCQGISMALACKVTVGLRPTAIVLQQLQGEPRELPPGSAVEQSFSFRLPPEPMSYEGTYFSIAWSVVVEVKLARRRDWAREVPLKVLPLVAARGAS